MNNPDGYLILLNRTDERSSWGFQDDVVVVASGKIQTIQRWSCADWLKLKALGASSPWILVFSDHSLSSKRDECKKRLCELVGKSVRIWHHGGLNNDPSTTMSKVREKFAENSDGTRSDFSIAGFSEEAPVMPFSTTTTFPWQIHLDAVRKQLFEEGKLPFLDALKNLDDAWAAAARYFDREKPIQAVLEALFPLYVDVCNILPEGSAVLTDTIAEAQVVIDAGSQAWSNLDKDIRASIARILNDTDPGAATLKKIQGTLKGLNVEDAASFTEFKSAFKNLSKMCSEMFGLPDEGDERAPAMPSL